MKQEDYLATQTQLLALASVVSSMDLDRFIMAADMAEALGPMLDPTLYRQGAPRLGQIRRLAEAAREFQKLAREVVRAEQ